MNTRVPDATHGKVAFFDVDHTLIDANTASLYARHALERGEIGWVEAMGTLWAMARYRMGWADAGPWMRRAVRNLTGIHEDFFRTRCEELYRDVMSHHLLDAARDQIDWHRAQGHQVVLVTASLHTVVRPLADALEADDVVANRAVVEEGVLTGELVSPLCYGPGKLPLASQWAEERQVALRDCWFYTDSSTDLALLEAVGHPVAVHPDPRLKRFAKTRGWPIRQFRASTIGRI